MRRILTYHWAIVLFLEATAINDTVEAQICDVCERNPGHIFSSGVGPVSYMRCETCLVEGAELIDVICMTLYLNGGPGPTADSAQGNWWRQHARTYLNGRYVGWAEIAAAYPDYEAECAANFNSDDNNGEDDLIPDDDLAY